MAQRVLIVDQFSGVTPYYLKANPEPFEAFARRILTSTKPSFAFRAPLLTEVPDDFTPEFCTTVLRADADGNVEVWRHSWDTSG